MHEHEGGRANAGDPLAEIIRAAGRRAEPPEAYRDQVYEAAHSAWRKKVDSRRRLRWLAAAASVAGLIVAGAIFQVMTTSNTVPAATIAIARGAIELRIDDVESWQGVAGIQNLAPGAHLRTRGDGRATLALAAGGSLRLNVNTEIIVGRSRYELVSGTLYFDSEGRAPDSPIEIATAFGVVQDIGTQFEVATNRNSVRVRVRSGRVALTDSANNVDIAADAGSEVELAADGIAVQREFSPRDPAWSWAARLALPPSSRSILNYLTWIARETGHRLEFDPRNVERIAETENLIGNLEDHTPEEVLDLIVATTDFRYQTIDDGTIVIHRTEVP